VTPPAGKGRHRDIDHAIDGISTVNLDRLAKKLHGAYQTTLDHPSEIDGYKNSTFGASPATGGPSLIEDEDGNMVTLNLTKVEADALRRSGIDDYDKIVRDAINYLGDADRALRACSNKLDQLHGLQDDEGMESTEPGCWALERVNSWEPVAHTVVIEGDPRPLGTWAYKFHRTNGRLPTIEESKRHVRGQKIRVKA
jgi:hypothetical protein